MVSGLLLALAISNLLRAQTTTSGGLTGLVTDPSGAVVSSADVEIRNTSKGTNQSSKTDRGGAYQFSFLAPARYTLTVAHAGFETEHRAVEVLLGPPVTVNVTLRVAQATTTVSVTAEAPLVHAENGDVSTAFNTSQISEVPNPGNDLVYSILTAPGALMSIDGGGGAGFILLGMPATSNVITIDGINENENGNNVADTSSLNLLLGQNQMQEATVISTPYSGQFGGAAGGQISYLTKSGSGVFHGNVQYYWNGRVLNANDWFSNANGSPRPFDNAHQWAGSLGGPVKKDKLFFFFDTEGTRVFRPPPGSTVLIPSQEFEQATLANITNKVLNPQLGPATLAFYQKIFNLYDAAPGAKSAQPGSGLSVDPTGCTGFTGLGNDPVTKLPIPCARHFFFSRSRASQETLASGRFDWNVGANDRAFLRLQYDRSHNPSSTDPISSLFDTDFAGPWWQGQISETHTFGSSAASQFLLGGSYHLGGLHTANPAKAIAALPATLSFGCCTTDLFANLGAGNPLGFGRADTKYQISEDIDRIWGRHKFGLGANFRHINWTGTNTPGQPALFAQTYGAFYWGGVDNHNDPSPGVTNLGQGFVTGGASNRFSFYEIGFYGQDEWQAHPNLTLTLALRAEHQSNPVCKQRCFARLAGSFQSSSHDPAEPYNKAILINQRQGLPSLDAVVWSPRFSFAWQPFGARHSSVLRGGIGIFYDTVHGYTGTSAGGNPPLNNGFTVSGDNLALGETPSNLFQDAIASNDGFVNGFKAGQTLAQIQAVDPNFFPPSANGWVGKPHPAQYQRWSLEWEQGFGVFTSLSFGYHGYHGIHTLVEDPDANAWGFGSLPKGLCSSPPVPPCADRRFSGVVKLYSAAVSNYHGMVVSLKHRFRSQGQLQANYTFSHAFDEVSNGGDYSFNFGGDILNPQDPNNLRGAYGPAEYDIRHSFNANYVWEVPFKSLLGGHGPDFLLKGWEISGTVFARTGEPSTAFDALLSQTLQAHNYFGTLYAVPARAPGNAAFCGEGAALPLAPRPCFPPQVDPTTGQPNPDALFLQSGCETGFNSGTLPGPMGPCMGSPVSFVQRRNSFRAPKFVWTDFAITKNTKVPGWENATLGIGFQFFNLFNHTNFGGSDNYMSNSTFGEIFYLTQPPTGILGGGASQRMIQAKAQLRF